MSITELDNPIWYSLNNAHHHLAIGNNLAKCYPADVFFFAAVQEDTDEAFAELAQFVDAERVVLVVNRLELDTNEWETIDGFVGLQMVYTQAVSTPPDNVNIQALSGADVPDMMALIELTKPGPFYAKTIEMGTYLGIWQDEQLVAMAGTRMCTPNYQEISSVCTHPNYRGRGYGSLLTNLIVQHIQQDGIKPFLHVLKTNNKAIQLYEKLSFETYQEKEYTVLRRKAGN